MSCRNSKWLSVVLGLSLAVFAVAGCSNNENMQQEDTVIDLFEKADLLGSDINIMLLTSGSIKDGEECAQYSKKPKKDDENVDGILLNILGVKNQSNSAPLEGNPGVYDVLAEDFVARILAEASLPVGADVHMLRLMLAEEGHSVIIDGVEYPLEVPSGVQSGFKLIFKEYDCQIKSDGDLLLVDIQFKLIKNVHGYKLRPTAFVYCAHNEDPADDPDDPCDPEEEEEEPIR